MFLVIRVTETATVGDVAPIKLAVAGKMRCRGWRIRSCYVPNTNLSGSCVPNSGLSRDKLFLKGQGTVGGYARSSHIYNSGRYTVRRPGRGPPQRRGVPQRRVSVDDVIRYRAYDCVVTVIEGSGPVVDKKGASAAVCE